MSGRGQISLGARFVLLTIAALVLMVVDHKQQHLQRVRDVLALAVLPMQIAVDMPFRAWSAATASLTERQSLLSENERLRREVRESRFRLQTLLALQRENQRLRELEISLDDLPDQKKLSAEIMNIDLDNRQHFLINRGRVDGVYVSQPLLDVDGVVGQITSVYEHQSEAVLITDASHRIPVTNMRSEARTIAEGTGDTGLLRLPYLTNEADIEVGDRLVSSGLGGVFPRGRPVAIVEKVTWQPGFDFADVLARPVSSLDRERELVLVWLPQPLDAVDAPASVVGLSG
jgi:rod shape-determining protein MreC